MEVLGYDFPLWLVITALLFALYKYQTWHFGFFKELGINGPRPWPLFGNSFSLFTKGLVYHDTNLVQKYGKVFGFFQGRKPIMMVSDIDMLKEILVKRFDHFQNRQDFEGIEPPFNLAVSLLKDDHWKHVRTLLSPTFSTTKLKQMSGLINHSGEVLVKKLKLKAEKGEVIEFRGIAESFTVDVIGSTAFGLLVDSQEDPDNEYIRVAKQATEVGFSLAMLIALFAPSLLKHSSKVGIRFFPKGVMDFLAKMAKQAIQTREAEIREGGGVKRADLLQQMLNVQREDFTDDIGGVGGDSSHLAVDDTGVWSNQALTEDEIIGQCMVFFIAGFDTTAGMISWLVYCLATNPDCQEKLIEEIDGVMEQNSNPTYDLVKHMPYLDMCINECLRMYPIAPRTDRECQKDITINGVYIPEGTVVAVPIYSLHRDPNVWEEPELFRPERFSPEAKASRDPLYHIPFGYGPRSCIGMRLALFEGKMCMVHLLQNFRIVRCEETQVPIKLEKLRMRGEKGISVKLEIRK